MTIRRSKARTVRVLMCLLPVLLTTCLPAFPQSTSGRMLGTIADQSGAAIVGATVVVTDLQRGTSRTLSTDDAGQYLAPNLSPSLYKVRIEAHGFQAVERTGVRVEVATDVRLDFSMKPGQATETVQVSADAPLLNTTSATLGGTLSNQEINDLPLNGRDFQNLVVLRPGIMRYPGGGIGSVSANGIRPEDNNYIVDGVDNNDSYFGQSVINGSGVQGTPATILPIDAIQEFNVLEDPSAEYGWKPGATINVGLKSGTNSLHGTAYYFGRNAALDGRNYFNPAPNPKALRLHQFGGTVGGALIKDKLFFFTAYEGVRSLVGVTNIFSTPATVSLPDAGNCFFTGVGDCANSIPDALADLQAGGFPVNPLSQNLQNLFPANNGANPNGIITDFPNTDRGDNGLAKIDYHLNPTNVVSGTYFIGDSLQNEQDQPVLQPQWLSQATTRGQFVGLSWTAIPNSRWVNEARFGYNRLWQTFFTVDGHQNPATAYGINTGVTNPVNFGMPTIRIAGFGPPPPAGIFGGNAGWPQLLLPAANFQLVDNVSYMTGRHAFRFGGELRRSSIEHAKNRLGKGRVDFNGGAAFGASTSLEDFFAGDPTRGRIAIGDSHRQLSFWSYAGFLQDDWRATPRLTVNLGLRYELNTVIKEAHNMLGNFDPILGVVQVGQQIKSPYNGDHNNFAPRLGLAWDVTGKGKTILRAGAGVMYEIPHFDTFIGQFNFNNDPGTIGLNIVPTGAIGIGPGGANGTGTINAGVQRVVPGTNLSWVNGSTPVFNVPSIDCTALPCDTFSVKRNLRTPYVTSWNLNVQEALTNTLALEVGYVGNHGTKIFSVLDINQVDPNSPAEIACGQCEQNGRPFFNSFPNVGFINQLGNAYESSYNGLQTSLTERPAHGLSFILGYTYSHALDQGSDNRAPQASNSLNPRGEYGSSDFDIKHRLTLSMTYAIPGKKSVGQLLEGWQLNSIVSLQTGQPWNVVDTGNDSSLTGESGDRWNFSGNPAAFKPVFGGIPFDSSCGCYREGNSVMTLPSPGTWGNMHRNMFRGPGLKSWDLSIVKNFKFGERVTAQLRGEFFNILNHPNFANPYGVNFTFAHSDPSAPGAFGCLCATPDVADANPVIGTGGPRNVQLGIKFGF